MKTTLLRTATTAGLALALCGAAWADQADPAGGKPVSSERSFTGIVAAVNAKENILTARQFLLKKSFSVGEDCAFTLAGGKECKLADLQPGYKVAVKYINASGVAVARRVSQVEMAAKGSIDTIDRHARTMSVKQGWFLRKFQLPQDCEIRLRNDRAGTLEDLKIGHPVQVTYRTAKDGRSAYRIEQRNREFAGTIEALDAATETVKARRLMDDKKFNLAKDCHIIVNGRKDARLADLKIGEMADFSYELVEGVAIVHRIAQGKEPVVAAQAKPARAPGSEPERELETTGLNP